MSALFLSRIFPSMDPLRGVLGISAGAAYLVDVLTGVARPLRPEV